MKKKSNSPWRRTPPGYFGPASLSARIFRMKQEHPELSRAEIAGRLNCSPDTVTQVLNRSGYYSQGYQK